MGFTGRLHQLPSMPCWKECWHFRHVLLVQAFLKVFGFVCSLSAGGWRSPYGSTQENLVLDVLGNHLIPTLGHSFSRGWAPCRVGGGTEHHICPCWACWLGQQGRTELQMREERENISSFWIYTCGQLQTSLHSPSSLSSQALRFGHHVLYSEINLFDNLTGNK